MKDYKKSFKQYDFPLIIITILLIGFGLIALTSASYPNGEAYHGSGYYHLKRQAAFMILGLISLIFTANLNRKILQVLSGKLFFLSLILVFALWIPYFADERFGQARWFKVPIINFRFQPSDFIKVTSVLYFANLLELNKNRMNNKYTFITLVMIMIISVGPIMLKDLSTGVVIGFSLLMMLIVGGLRMHQFISLIGIGLLSLPIMLLKFGYRMKRIFTYFVGKEDTDPTNEGYHILQSLYAIAMGGYGGVGLFHSRQKYFNLPLAYNDFIFSIICEEFGFIGATFLIILFFLFIYRGLYIAYNAKNYYDKYVAVGLTSSIGIQAIFNMGVSCKLFPVTGITLPFISYGGTSLFVTMATVGLILRISRDV